MFGVVCLIVFQNASVECMYFIAQHEVYHACQPDPHNGPEDNLKH
jgi:hypothetical protein